MTFVKNKIKDMKFVKEVNKNVKGENRLPSKC